MKILPQFPLQLVVYPGETLNLHIFEPRYKELVKDTLKSGGTFGIPAFINKKVSTIGTEVELIKLVKEFDNGEMDIKTKGIGIYKIHEFKSKWEDKLYAGAEVERLEIKETSDYLLAQKVIELVNRLYTTMKITKEIPTEPENLQIYDIAHNIGCNINQEHQILSIPDEIGRLNYVIEHLEKLLPIVKNMENLRKKIQMNGHFKNILPPDFKA